MKLKEFIYLESKKFNTDISTDSLAALVLKNISRNKNFKELTDHLELIQKGEEIRLFAMPLNNVSGVTNNIIRGTVLQSDPKDYHLDSYHDEDDDNPIIYLQNEKFENINKFYDYLNKSDSFVDFYNIIAKEDELLIDVSQNITSLHHHKSQIKGLNTLTELLKYTMVSNMQKGNYEIGNDEISFGFSIARDIFKCSELSSLAGRNDESALKYIINYMKKAPEILFCNNKTGKVGGNIIKVFDDDSIENWEAVKLIKKNEDYQNRLLDIAVSTTLSIKEKHLLIADEFFQGIKQNALKSKPYFLSQYKSDLDIDNKYKKIINNITNKAEKKFPFLKGINNEQIELKEIPPSGEYENSPIPEYTSNLMNFDFYDDHDYNKGIMGIGYANSDNFSYTKNKDEVLITLKNDNTIIGIGDFYKENDYLRVNIVNISKLYRGEKRVKQIYQELMKYAEEKNLPILTTSYTRMGSERLPKLKSELLKKNKNVLWVQNCSDFHQNDVDKFFSKISTEFLRIRSEYFPNVKISILRESWDNQKKIVENKLKENENNWDFKYKLKNDVLSNMKKEIEESIKLRQKTKNKKAL